MWQIFIVPQTTQLNLPTPSTCLPVNVFGSDRTHHFHLSLNEAPPPGLTPSNKCLCYRTPHFHLSLSEAPPPGLTSSNECLFVLQNCPVPPVTQWGSTSWPDIIQSVSLLQNCPVPPVTQRGSTSWPDIIQSMSLLQNSPFSPVTQRGSTSWPDIIQSMSLLQNCPVPPVTQWGSTSWPDIIQWMSFCLAELPSSTCHSARLAPLAWLAGPDQPVHAAGAWVPPQGWLWNASAAVSLQFHGPQPAISWRILCSSRKFPEFWWLQPTNVWQNCPHCLAHAVSQMAFGWLFHIVLHMLCPRWLLVDLFTLSSTCCVPDGFWLTFSALLHRLHHTACSEQLLVYRSIINSWVCCTWLLSFVYYFVAVAEHGNAPYNVVRWMLCGVSFIRSLRSGECCAVCGVSVITSVQSSEWCVVCGVSVITSVQSSEWCVVCGVLVIRSVWSGECCAVCGISVVRSVWSGECCAVCGVSVRLLCYQLNVVQCAWCLSHQICAISWMLCVWCFSHQICAIRWMLCSVWCFSHQICAISWLFCAWCFSRQICVISWTQRNWSVWGKCCLCLWEQRWNAWRIRWEVFIHLVQGAILKEY